MKTNKEIENLYNLCKRHNWYYRLNWEIETYSLGFKNEIEIKELCKNTTIFEDFKKFMFSGDTFNCKLLPEPLLENYLNKNTILDNCQMRGINCNLELCKNCKYNIK
jgi:hypothetical protein